MVIYSDRTLVDLVQKGLIISENFSAESVTPNGYDLRVGKVRIPGSEDSEMAEIPPMTFFLVSTLEYMNIPRNAMGELWIRSSYARRGIIASFGAVDSGFRGNLTLSFFNSSAVTVKICRGERIAQIVFQSMDTEADRKYDERSGNYQNSRGIVSGVEEV
ncbi:MAG: dCTP deaminase [Thermoplasmataceae archaeon]